MRCSQSEHLLSLNLDGRLSSGQRRALTDHLTQCGTCQNTDKELNAARELALSLPVQHVSGGFREELWQRIRAGEGTPEAVFREPVPLATKLRYFGTGAAAAGLLIFAAHWLRSQAPVHAPQSSGPHAVEVAEARPGKLVPRDSIMGLSPATPDGLAELVADGYTDAVRTLHARAQTIETQPLTSEGIDKLRQQIEYANRYAGMLRWLDGKYLNLLEDDRDRLTAIELVGDQVRSHRDADSLRRVLRPIQSLRVEAPRNFFCNPCVKDEADFYQEFLVRLRTSQLDSAIGSKIQLVVEPTTVGSERVMVYFVR